MNPLVSDRFVDFLLHEVLDVSSLCALPAFAEHERETFDLWIGACRKVAREVLFPSYRAMDEAPPRLEGGRVIVHPRMRAIWKELVDLGVIAATRPAEVGGQRMPLAVSTLASAYLMAGNLSAYGYAGLTTGAAHLIEAFGDAALRETYMAPLYEGRWTGTMTLTEPQAGSSLADVQTRATPTSEGHHLLRGAKIFISGGDHDVTENVVHLVLARIEGAPAGTKGISLFVVPKRRPTEDGTLVDNDVTISGVIHKIGWRGLPSVALALGDANECRGWLLGAPGAGLRQMFQMMNEARLMVGVNAAATASVAYQESLAYAKERTQGRPLGVDPTRAPVPILEHADVRRMLLRQKAIVEGALCLLGVAARYADLSEHSIDPAERERSKLLLDLLTPIAKSFPSERGFESNALAVQIHGGYGYSSEYLPESWLRDQKLNSIHEGTTGIQGLDLLGRKVVAGGGAAIMALRDAILADVALAEAKSVDPERLRALRAATERVVALTATLGARGASGDLDGMMGHSADYLELASILVVSWMWIRMSAIVAGRDDPFARGIEHAARYWIATELPRVDTLAALCESAERSYLDVDADAL
ncbi:MAG: acyl-CoA dehydrogenase [Myxococcota bacterium]|nr:acyl-CoA dehydrogenase [Myxococcota bacterium]